MVYLHFLSFLKTDIISQNWDVVEILPHERQEPTCPLRANAMAADDLVMQGAKASTAMLLY